jgi:hypothetical protein
MADTKEERRADKRAPMALRAEVRGFDPDGRQWQEHVTTLDVSLHGAQFPIQHRVDHGQILLMVLPMPIRYRRHDHLTPLYRVYALVRHMRGTDEGQRAGVRLLGKLAPREYEKYPACRYFVPGEPLPAGDANHRRLADPAADGPSGSAGGASAEERRRSPRLDVFTDFRICRLSPGTEQERTVAENISHGGARVLTALPIQKGEIVRLEEVGGSFNARAEVVNTYVGDDRALRLNLRFIDGELPKRLMPDLPE